MLTSPSQQAARWETGLWLALVVLIGLNLRPFLTAVGPLTTSISGELGLGYQEISLLTLLPILLMGVGAFLGAALRQLLGVRRAMLGAIGLLGMGVALRALVGSGGELIGTAILCGVGVAVIQAAFPGEIKRRFPAHTAMVTGLFSAALMGGGALGAQLSPVLAGTGGAWRLALASWALPIGLAFFLAVRMLPRAKREASAARPAAVWLARPRTWLLMACFGLVNGGYASLVAWLAPYYQARGWSATDSASLIALMAVAQATSALVLPALSGSQGDRRPWIGLTLGLQALGFTGLALFPGIFPHAWVLMLGAGLGGCFALLLIVALDHLPDAQDAGALSAMMQGGGFLLASGAPWILAVLHGLSGSFVIGWLAHLACALGVLGLSLRLDPARFSAAMGLPHRESPGSTSPEPAVPGGR